MDLEEMEQYRHWVLAGGKPNKFPWSSSDHAGSRPGGVGESVASLGRALFGNVPKSDPWSYAKAAGKTIGVKAKKFDEETGKFLGFVYVDEEGQEIDTSDYVIVESHHKEAQALARRVFDIEES